MKKIGIDSRRSSPNRRRHLTGWFAIGVLATSLTAPAWGEDKFLLLIDDFYQKSREELLYSQGVALTNSARDNTNYYSPIANASSNGLFALSELLSDKFKIRMSPERITAELLDRTDAYMLVCPIKVENGGRGQIGPADVDLLVKFVVRGGRLVVVMNSIPKDLGDTEFDLEAVNALLGNFGIQFNQEETGTISVPLGNEQLIGSNTELIFGNGTTIALAQEGSPDVEVLLRDNRESSAHEPLGVLVKHGMGRVLAFGDAGTFGNAHVFRGDIKHAEALRAVFLALLPEGSFPRYDLDAMAMARVEISSEQLLGGYDHENRLLQLPKSSATTAVESSPRLLDLNGAPSAGSSPDDKRYTVYRLADTVSLKMDLAPLGSEKLRKVEYSSGDGRYAARMALDGRIIDSTMPTGALADWQWFLSNQMICSPLASYAKIGDTWEVMGLEPLPQFQLSGIPALVPATVRFEIEGEEVYEGIDCLVIKRTSWNQAEGWSFSDIVNRESLMQFGPNDIKIMSGGQLSVTRYWLDREKRRPVRTEMVISCSLWWKDSAYADRYEGHHDWRNFETWKTVNFVADYGRKITAIYNYPQ